ncbi:sensor domain-containing diguanylate cyclase [Carnobacterium sp.]|uniref:sensor domain-containing diguanylate cyclase n=1 Tax=Carnobacterium sp. TaxID=48221 RepID=UPI003C75768D
MKNDTQEELILEMASLKRLNKELLIALQDSERLEFEWTKNLGQWFWDFTTNEVTFNPLKAEAIGYLEIDLPEKVPFQFFTDKIHPDDKENVMQLMTNHLKGESTVWRVKYRIQAKDGSYKMYHDFGKVTERDKQGAPLFLKGVVFDITEEEYERDQLVVRNKKLSDQMKIDSLTSLHTRSSLVVELAKHVRLAKEYTLPLSVLFLKVDHYTEYEELFGIVMSEEILKVIGQIIQTVIKENGHVAGRYRESVFLILLNDIQEDEAYALANKIRQTVFETLFDVSRHVTISSAISVFNSEETISELINNVSKKLLTAVKNGGNQIVM